MIYSQINKLEHILTYFTYTLIDWSLAIGISMGFLFITFDHFVE